MVPILQDGQYRLLLCGIQAQHPGQPSELSLRIHASALHLAWHLALHLTLHLALHLAWHLARHLALHWRILRRRRGCVLRAHDYWKGK
jgi:hypothetical protein